jgi:hypothetical protein
MKRSQGIFKDQPPKVKPTHFGLITYFSLFLSLSTTNHFLDLEYEVIVLSNGWI